MRTSRQHLKRNKLKIFNQYSTKRNIYQDASKDAHQINSSVSRIASETHLEFSSTGSIEDSCIEVGDKNDKYRDQEPRKNNGDKDNRS